MEKIEVIWYDAASEEVHCLKERLDSLTPITRRNIGYLYKDEDKFITMVFGILEFEETQYQHPLAIPKNMIRSMVKIYSSQDLPNNEGTRIDY